jgi:hypothetical protein
MTVSSQQPQSHSYCTVCFWSQATDTSGSSSVHPNGLRPGYPQYEGTVIALPAEATCPIPLLYW